MLADAEHGAWVGQFWGHSIAEIRADVARLEAAGYRVLWISEALGREAFAFAGVLLGATQRLTVATGIANMWVRDPVAMRNGARTLAEAYPGRFVLGVGVSHGPLVDRRGHDYTRPLEMAAAYLAGLATAEYRVPAPDVEPEVLVGALGDRMLQLAAEHTDGAHPYLVTPEHTARAREVLGPDLILAPEQAVVLTDDPTVARSGGRAHLATYLRLDNYVRSMRRQGFSDDDVAGGGSDRLVDGLVAWGNQAAIEARLREHFDAGADHVAIQPLMVPGAPDPVDQLVALAGSG